MRGQILQDLEDHIQSLGLSPKNKGNALKILSLENLVPASLGETNGERSG